MRKATPATTPAPLYVYFNRFRECDPWVAIASNRDPDILKDIYAAADRHLYPDIQQKIEKY